MRALTKGLLLIAGLAAGVSPALAAKTVYVANNGVDHLFCGSAANPCRSISLGIAHATSGDRILVGPGVYGELDFDGHYTSPGEERAEGQLGCDCVVKVDKSLTIESSLGAGATLIRGNAEGAVVRIMANNTTFGSKNHGFTVLGIDSTDRKLSTAVYASALYDVTVEGNILENAETGVRINSLRSRAQYNRIALNDVGLDMRGGTSLARGNSVVANDYGFVLAGTQQLVKSNVIVANSVNGVAVNLGKRHVVSDNSVVGNQGPGVRVDFSCPSLICTGARAEVTDNDIFGNDGEQVFRIGGGGNCGLSNGSDPGLPPLIATGNFWGVASGPGPNPADAVCASDLVSTNTAPVATTEFDVAVSLPK